MVDKKASDVSGLSPSKKSALNSLLGTEGEAKIDGGMNCTLKVEPVPNFNKAPCEVVLKNSNNSWIVLGRDRPAGTLSGYGGYGFSQAGMIDLVVGRMNPVQMEVHPSDGGELKVDNFFVPYVPEDDDVPSFTTDSARVYISQKTDVDINFNLVRERSGNSEGKSAVAIKADAVRIMANESIKLVTAPDKMNSYGVPTTTIQGISLIAGNIPEDDEQDGLQPLVRGFFMSECVHAIVDMIMDLNFTVQGVVNECIKLNKQLGKHVHGVAGAMTNANSANTPAAAANLRLNSVSMQSLENNVANLESVRKDYVMPNGSAYVCSRYNNTN